MYDTKTAVQTALAGLISLGLLASTPAAAEDKAEAEKCYGVAKAGKNDCQTANNACAGHVSKDNQADAWIYVPKGTCERIVGGSTQPKG
jgi:uncharacterized membrane protein